MDGNLARKEGRDYELFDGKAVMLASPSMSHLFVADSIHDIFKNYLRGKPCEAVPDGATLYLKDEKGSQICLKPDMMVVCDKGKIRWETGSVYGAPDLLVEVLSPGTARYDRGRKMRFYELNGIREYWIVDPRIRVVEQYILEDGNYRLRDMYTLFTKEMLDDMDEEDRAEAATQFRCSLYDDLIIRLEDIFERAEP